MTPQPSPRLTERERDKAQLEFFENERRKFLLVLEAMGTDSRWFQFFVNRDFLPMATEMDKALWNYLKDCGDFENALSEAQRLKENE